ncbi:MAG: hypothetical protein F6K39_08110 [Okeania sp. SIO3B3]|nr:hypothetical protein [Okeania sp. SIO3B3]
MNSYTLGEGRQKAEGRRQKAEGKERFKGRRFFITNYPDMILLKIVDRSTFTAVFIWVDHSRDVPWNVPTRFCL